MYTSSTSGNIEIVELLLNSATVDIDSQDNENNSTALLTALINNHTDIAKLLIKEGANVDLADDAGLAPLHVAAVYGWLDLVKMIVEEGEGNVNLVDYEGNF